jgi:hypothetical protein
MTKDYHEYLLSPEWKEFRKKALEHYGRKCSRCHRTKNLQVHHLTYDNIFNERLEDVEILCKKHHELTHGIKPPKEKPKKKGSHKQNNFNKLSKKARRRDKRNKNKLCRKVKEKNFNPIKTKFPAIDKILEAKQMREVWRMRVVE